MPTFNSEMHIAEAVQSILSQSFTGFELLVVDDHSKDASAQIVKSFRDPRIRVVPNEGSQGVANAFNTGVQLAAGTYVARMDSDDISHPSRLEKQWMFLEQNPEISVVGGSIEILEPDGGLRRDSGPRPYLPGHVAWSLLFYCSLAFPTVMMRRKDFEAVGGCDPKYSPADDYDLWLRMLRRGLLMANLRDVVLTYRINPMGLSHSPDSPMRELSLDLLDKAWTELLGPDTFHREAIDLIREPHRGNRGSSGDLLETVDSLLEAALRYAETLGLSDSEAKAIRKHSALMADRLYWHVLRKNPMRALRAARRSVTTSWLGLATYPLRRFAARIG